MIQKQTDSYTGQVQYCKCTICGIITNYDVDECPKKHEHMVKKLDLQLTDIWDNEEIVDAIIDLANKVDELVEITNKLTKKDKH